MPFHPMKSRFQGLSIVFSLIWISFNGCVKETTLDAGGEREVVVECVLSDTEVQELRLSYTFGASKIEATPVTEARAQLADLTTGEMAGFFSRSEGEDVWTLAYTAVAGHSYRLDVTIPGHDPISARQTMPQTVIRGYGKSAIQSVSGEIGKTNIVFPSPVPEYIWIYGLSNTGETPQHGIVEEICTDYPFVDNFNLTGSVYNPPLLGHIEALPFYSYLNLDKAPMHRRYLRIPKGSDTGEKNLFFVSGLFEYSIEKIDNLYSPNLESFGYGTIVVMSLSEEYDRFLREALLLSEQQQSSTSLADIYLRYNIYSNVQGALGVFGAKLISSFKWYVGPDSPEPF